MSSPSITLKCGSAKSFFIAAFFTSGADVGLDEAGEVGFGGEGLGVFEGGRRRQAPALPAPGAGAGAATATSLGLSTAGAGCGAGSASANRFRLERPPFLHVQLALRPPAEETVSHCALAAAVLLVRRHRRRIAEAVLQPPGSSPAACASSARARSAHRRTRASSRRPRRRRHLLHGFLRVEPAAGVVVADRDDHPAARSAPRPPWRSSSIRHSTNQHGAGGGVQVVALGVVAEQFDPEARMQPALLVLVRAAAARLAAEGRLVAAPPPPAPSARAASGCRCATGA